MTAPTSVRRYTLTPLSMVVLFTAVLAVSVQAETLYVDDTLTVPLRTGPTTGHRIVHQGLPAGTKLEVLATDADSDFVQIRTERGTEGWLPRRYLTEQPIARDRLVVANRQIEQLRAELGALRSRLSEANSANADQSSNIGELSRDLQSTREELSELRKISGDAVAAHNAKSKLTQLNTSLREEIDRLVAERNRLAEQSERNWLLLGGALVLAGMLLGGLMKSRPRRSGWS